MSSPKQDLEILWQRVMSLREEERQSAEDKYQVSLLLATTEKLCRTLTDFMNATESELQKMNDGQMKLLNVQEQYKSEIRTEVVKILDSTYATIKTKQKEVLDKMLDTVQTSVNTMEKTISDCKDNCDEAVKNVDKSIRKMYQLDSWGDWLFLLSPLLVLGDIVMRIIPLFK